MLLHFIVFLKLPNLKTSRCMQYFHFVLKTNLCAKKRNTTHFVRYFFFATDYFKTCYRAFSCDVIAAMLEGKNNTFSLPWEIRCIFMQNCFIVSDFIVSDFISLFQISNIYNFALFRSIESLTFSDSCSDSASSLLQHHYFPVFPGFFSDVFHPIRTYIPPQF